MTISAITLSQVYVLDQDEAVDFYVGKLGLVVTNDLDLGFMRWLTVAAPTDPTREVLLELPGPPVGVVKSFGPIVVVNSGPRFGSAVGSGPRLGVVTSGGAENRH